MAISFTGVHFPQDIFLMGMCWVEQGSCAVKRVTRPRLGFKPFYTLAS
jgi:hypothetical protein